MDAIGSFGRAEEERAPRALGDATSDKIEAIYKALPSHAPIAVPMAIGAVAGAGLGFAGTLALEKMAPSQAGSLKSHRIHIAAMGGIIGALGSAYGSVVGAAVERKAVATAWVAAK